MAEFTAYQAFDYRLIDLYEGFENAQFVPDQADPSHRFYVYPSADTALTIEGHGFSYLPNGIPVSGTTTSAGLFIGGNNQAYKLAYTLSHISVTVEEAAAYVQKSPEFVIKDIFKGRDEFHGSRFADHINGFKGKDELTGGHGADTFYFTVKEKAKTFDTITDFKHRQDHIALDNAIFDGIGNGNLRKTFHDITDAAVQKNDRILYNSDTGVLSYDSDGSGSDKAVKIAVLYDGAPGTPDQHPTLTAGDILVV